MAFIAGIAYRTTDQIAATATQAQVQTGAVGSAFGAGVATALAVAVGTNGAPVIKGGDAGTPSAINLTNATNTPGPYPAISVQSGDFTIVADGTVYIYTGSGGNTFTGPFSANPLNRFVIKNRGSASLTFTGGSNNIDGAASWTLAPLGSVTILFCDSLGEWIMISPVGVS